MTEHANAFRQGPGVSLGINEAMIWNLVDTFYERVRSDSEIGPIFVAAIADWRPHLDTMVKFWSSVALMSGTYKGKPIAAHMPLGLTPHHFLRWLSLFEQTAHDVCPPVAATFFVARAQKIAQSIKMGVGIAGNQSRADPQVTASTLNAVTGDVPDPPGTNAALDSALTDALINSFPASDPYSLSFTPSKRQR
jgi:hemoglobin